LLSRTDNFTVTDGISAVELDSILGGTDCADYVGANFYDKLAIGAYYDANSGTIHDTNSYIQTLRDHWFDEGIGNYAAWELGVGLYSAYVVGANTTEWLENLKAEIDELDGRIGNDVIGLAGAVLGLAAAGEDYDPQAGEHAAASGLADLADILTDYQLNSGGFTFHKGFRDEGLDEMIHETTYALLALKQVGRSDYPAEISDAGIHVQTVQLVSGGWSNYIADVENNMSTGEALWALVAAAGVPVVPDLTGMAQADANLAIIGAGLAVGTVGSGYSDTIPAGHVTSQDPPAGTEMPFDWPVDIVVSLGSPVVPVVVGLQETDANLALAATSLVVGTVTYDYNDTIPPWEVISQDPAPGTTVSVGSAVDLVVSLGQPIIVPDIVGRTETEANSDLTSVGLTVGTVAYEYNDTVPVGQVITQSPIAGAAVPISSGVDMVVSGVIVPDVVDMTEANASLDIVAAGLVVGTVTYQYSDTVSAGTVIDQSPVAAAVAGIGSAVDLIVSAGQPLVPSVAGMTVAEANSTLAAESLTVGAVTYEHSDTAPADLVISQNPTTGTTVSMGSPVDLIVSLGQPVVPNVVGQTLAAATAAIEAVETLVVGTVIEQFSETVAAGLVIDQNPAGETAVPLGSYVDLIVSLGPPVVVPDVVEQTEAEAISTISAVSGLSVGTVVYEYNDTVAAYLVISQDPAGETMVPVGSAVDLIVSLGQAVVVPDVVNWTEPDANSAIDSVGLVPNIIYQHSDSVPAGLVISQNPAAGTTVSFGSSVDIFVSLGQSFVPYVVGTDELNAYSVIAAADLTVGTVIYQYDAAMAVGLVISQNPVAGTPVLVGTGVDLVVSLGQPVTVPDVVDRTKFEANSILAAAGLEIGTVTYEFNDVIAAAVIISQNPIVGSPVPAGSGIDLAVSLGQPAAAMALAGNRLVELQNNDGGWDPQLDDGDPNAGRDDVNFASTAMGLAQAYRETSDANMLAALQKSKLLLLSKTDNFAVTDGTLAVELDDILGGTACADYVNTNFYDKLAAGTYYDAISDANHSTASYVQALRDPNAGNLAAWRLGLGLQSAHKIGADTSEWIAALKAEIDELSAGSSDVLGLAAAVLGMAAAGEDYDPQAGQHAAASNLSDLAEILAAYQLGTGGFTWWGIFMDEGLDEAVHETTYAIMALNEFDRTGYIVEISDAGIYLQNGQLMTGGWQEYVGTGAEQNEFTGKALWALAIATGEPTVVPDVTDQNEADANSHIAAAGLVVDLVSYDYSDTVPVGIVISQNPLGGTTVPDRSTVDIVVSVGPAVVVPDVVDANETDANSAITVAGLVVGDTSHQYSDIVAEGLIIGQNPFAGTTVPAGTAVDLLVSLGQPTVPDVVGMSEPNAILAVEAIDNLTVDDIYHVYSDTVPAGLVITQNPAGLTRVPIGWLVDLVVSLGQGVTVPYVEGMNQASANSTIVAAGLVVGNTSSQYSDTVAAGFVITQDPNAGIEVPIGSTVDLVVSSGQPEVPDVVGWTQAGANAAIMAAGLTVGTVDSQYSDSVTAGLVISQDPISGTPAA
ncbi:MAG: PASTA domain-containing protein, partial [Planctomycetota bacterium]